MDLLVIYDLFRKDSLFRKDYGSLSKELDETGPCAARRFSSLRRSWLFQERLDSFSQERSEHDQISRAIESNICFYPVFDLILTNILKLSSSSTLLSLTINFYFYSRALSNEGGVTVHKDR